MAHAAAAIAAITLEHAKPNGKDKDIPSVPKPNGKDNKDIPSVSNPTDTPVASAAASASSAAVNVDGEDMDPLEELKSLKLRVGGGRVCNPRGTRDLMPDQMRIREFAIAAIKDIYRRHGAVEISTPVLERLEVLLGQYGDGGKLIYRLREENENGEKLALRYDLTVPLARFMVQHGIKTIKRFHIADVFRRDKPSAGRFRQFTQCDFDIAGNHGAPRMCDAECMQMIRQVLQKLDIGQYVIKVNSRKILDGLMRIAGVKPEDFRKTCSIIDELDKMSWSEAQEKLVKLGHSKDTIEILGRYVNVRGAPLTIIKQLESDAKFMADPDANTGFTELKQVFELTEAMGVNDVVSFDLSLARGLDYYTGIIFEAFLIDPTKNAGTETQKSKSVVATDAKDVKDVKKSKPVVATDAKDVKDVKDVKKSIADEDAEWNKVGEVEVDAVPTGAICGGGRFDKLVGVIKHRFTGNGGAPPPEDCVQAVGFSFGIERLFSILESRAKKAGLTRANNTTVFIASAGSVKDVERMKLASELWSAGIGTEFAYESKQKTVKQMSKANEASIPFVILVGPDELKSGTVTIKIMKTGKQVVAKRAEIVDTLTKLAADPLNI